MNRVHRELGLHSKPWGGFAARMNWGHPRRGSAPNPIQERGLGAGAPSGLYTEQSYPHFCDIISFLNIFQCRSQEGEPVGGGRRLGLRPKPRGGFAPSMVLGAPRPRWGAPAPRKHPERGLGGAPAGVWGGTPRYVLAAEPPLGLGLWGLGRSPNGGLGTEPPRNILAATPPWGFERSPK